VPQVSLAQPCLRRRSTEGTWVTAIVRDPEKLEKREGLSAKAGDVLRHGFSCDVDPRKRSNYQRLQSWMEEPEPL